MDQTAFSQVLNMSLTGSVVMVVVLVLRLLLRKAPKVLSYALWGIVLFRLLCPVSIGSSFSVFTLVDAPVEQGSGGTSQLDYLSQVPVAEEEPTLVQPSTNNAPSIPREEKPSLDILPAVWCLGMTAMAAYALMSYLWLRWKLASAVHLRDNIYLADHIPSPFVLGLFRPKIYLPSSMEEKEQSYILLHEQHHIRRLDHIWKALGFLALTIHWFNPLVWVAFVLASKDMEMSCDEAVVGRLGPEVLADYSASLLSLATGKRIIAGMPLAFGEGDPKGRIRNLANWKKPAFWVVLAAVAGGAVLAMTLLTNPIQHQTVLAGADYSVGEELYRLYTQVTPASPNEVSITADYQFYIKVPEGDTTNTLWKHMGTLRPISLGKEELLLAISQEQREELRLAEVTDAYILNLEDGSFYLAAQTEDGETLLARGENSGGSTIQWLARLENQFQGNSVDGGFFARSLTHVVGAPVYNFHSYENDRIPGFHVEGFKCGEGNYDEMTDMGFAVFQEVGDGYRLIDCKVYADAALAEHGVFLCPDPAVLDASGRMTAGNTFDVILVSSETISQVEWVFRTDGKEDASILHSHLHDLEMCLLPWTARESNTTVTQNIYDINGKRVAQQTLAHLTLIPEVYADAIRNPWVQEYPAEGWDVEEIESINRDFDMGADANGVPVFKNPYRAFDTMVELYADGLAMIQRVNNLPPISRDQFSAYKTYGWQTMEGTQKENEQAMFVSIFLDYYENSFTMSLPASCVHNYDLSREDLSAYCKTIHRMNEHLQEKRVQDITITVSFSDYLSVEELADYASDHSVNLDWVEFRGISTSGQRITGTIETDMGLEQMGETMAQMADRRYDLKGITALQGTVDFGSLETMESDSRTYLADPSGDDHFLEDWWKPGDYVKSIAWELEDLGILKEDA